MRLLHLSDLHLGFRQYQRQTPMGINQREADVAQAFARAVDRILAIAPELIVIGGDVFHTVRPTNTAILHAFRQFGRLVHGLPETPIVIAAGNHDMPRSTESACILRLFEQGFAPRADGAPPILVADRAPRRLQFPRLGVSVLAVPDLPPGSVDLTPDPEARYNVLVLHGEVQGVLPAAGGEDRIAAQIPVEEVTRAGWDYVALGHYHVTTRVADHVWYSGSLEYTSTNPWGELREERAAGLAGKGMIERDLRTGAQTVHPLSPTRPLLDLPSVDGAGRTAAELDAAIASAVATVPGGIDGAIVRLVLRDVPRHVARELDHAALREVQRRALHFHLDVRRPESVRREASGGAPARRPTLTDALRAALASRALPTDVPREALVALGLRYLADAERDEGDRLVPGGEG